MKPVENIPPPLANNGSAGAMSLFWFLFLLFSFTLSAQTTEVRYLSGKGSNDAVPWQFMCTGGMNAGKWTTVAVPACWELQGFGKYDYGLAKDSVRGKEKGLYKLSFAVPSSWKNKTVNLCFEGVMTDADVKINGQSAGEVHQGAFYAFKYNITSLLKFGGENLLELTVSKHSANESVNAAERRGDYWLFGGVFRPVFLEALPLQHIRQVSINADADGGFFAAVATTNDKGDFTINLNIVGDKNKRLATFNAVAVNDSARHSFLAQRKLRNVRQWSPEAPNLYRAVVTLYRGGRAVHTVTKTFGFRTVKVKRHDGLYVNGVKVKFKGVNRHSFWPTTGRTTSKALSIEDVQLMKDMNMNAVRMSHYPPDDHFLDACDSLGLFVLDELAGWHGQYDTPTGSKRVKEMIEHDANHPCVVLWDNGNEGGHNPELDSLFAFYDVQKRSVIHPWQVFGGFDTQHYREYNYGIGNYEAGHDIVMPTEFLHGWYDGGAGAGLEDYWEKMWRNPLSAGGFLWDLADEGVVRKDLNDSVDTDKAHGADGIVGPFHQKEGSYYTVREVWSPVHFERKEITDEFDGSLAVENRYHFTSLLKCRFNWRLKSFRQPSRPDVKGTAASPDVAPSQNGVLKIDLPPNWKAYDVLYLSAFGSDGKEIFTWSFPVLQPATLVKDFINSIRGGKVSVQEEDSAYAVSANGVSLRLHKQTGLLLRVQNGKGDIPFRNGPVVQEAVNNFSTVSQRFDGDTVIIASVFDRKKSYNTLQWKIYPSGIVQLRVRYFPSDYFTWFDGVNFSFPESEIRSVEYTGNGPYRVWKNRLKGPTFGIWKKDYNNTETAESWKYPEFKGYYANLYRCRFITTSQPFTVYTENEDVFLRLFTPARKTDQWHNYEPYFPSGDISFMQGIPAIGSKTQRAETTGPMGTKNIFYDYEKDPARALEITLYFDFRDNAK